MRVHFVCGRCDSKLHLQKVHVAVGLGLRLREGSSCPLPSSRCKTPESEDAAGANEGEPSNARTRSEPGDTRCDEEEEGKEEEEEYRTCPLW